MLTPKETVDLASYLQLALTSKAKRLALSEQIIEALGLSHVENRRIGGGRALLFSGASLSGGERRRLSVGTLHCSLYFTHRFHFHVFANSK
jgi:ABC-type multidrug transport system ATPase subunit